MVIIEKKYRVLQILLETVSEVALSSGRFGIIEHNIVCDTLDILGDKEKQILYLYFFKNLSQYDISKVKRLHLECMIFLHINRMEYTN